MIRGLTLAVLLCWAIPGYAHSVIADLFVSGDRIEGEIAFSNGDPAAGVTVSVTGADGGNLGETVTDDDGFFSFLPEQPVAHHFRADLGAGHVALMELPADQVKALLTGQPAPITPAPAASVTANPDQQAIAALIKEETRLLRREIVALRERQTFQSILGGIGYVAGIFGLGFYMAARRRLDR